MNWQEFHKWLAEVERLTGGHVEVWACERALEVRVHWYVSGKKYGCSERIDLEVTDCMAHHLNRMSAIIRRYLSENPR